MEALLTVLCVCLALSVTYVIAWNVRRERAGLLERLAERSGLTQVERRSQLGLDTALVGRAGRLTVRLEAHGRSEWDEGLRIVVAGLGQGPYGLTVRPEGAGTALEKVVDGGEIELGDPFFDRTAFVQGDEALARAVLGESVRRDLGILLGGTLRAPGGPGEAILPVKAVLAGDELVVDVRRAPSSADAWLAGALAFLTDLGTRLSPPADLARGIAEAARTDSLAAVRARSLRLLAQRFPRHASTREALEAGRLDPDPEVRLEAALALGTAGQDVLRALAAAPDAPEAHAVRAVEALSVALGPEEAVALLRRALSAGRSLLAAAAARVLGPPSGPAAEPVLVEALAHPASDLRLAVAEALGRIGSPHAVLPLRETAEAHPLDLGLRRAARDSIAAIKARVPGASPGQLSLATAEAGELSLAEDDASGRLSLESPEAEPRESAAGRAGRRRLPSSEGR